MNVLVTETPTHTPAAGGRPLVRIVIVGHVDHGKSTLIGRLLHETGSLPDGKLDSLKAMSTRRGMPFEWSFLLDALQTERDQGITLDTSQIRFRTASRDVVLIDAPGHAIYKFDDRRIIAGRIETGRIAVGDEITIMPRGKTARVQTIEAWPVPDESRVPQDAAAGQSIGLTLDRDVFVDRGDVVTASD